MNNQFPWEVPTYLLLKYFNKKRKSPEQCIQWLSKSQLYKCISLLLIASGE